VNENKHGFIESCHQLVNRTWLRNKSASVKHPMSFLILSGIVVISLINPWSKQSFIFVFLSHFQILFA